MRTSPVTGLATFVTAGSAGRGVGGAIVVAPSLGRTDATPADFIRQHGHLFGVTDQARQLARVKTRADSIGHTHTTYRQVHQGVPVFSGVLKVHQNQAGEFIAANGDFYPIPPELVTVPTLDAAAAGRIATSAVSEGAVVARAELMIVDPAWYGDPPAGPRLAYRLVVSIAATGANEAFFIDAHKGDLLDRWSLTCTALERSVHDAAGTDELPGPLARAEGEPPVSDADVDAAYDYAGDTYEYFWRAFGRDSLDDAGLPLVLTVNSTAAPCPNAFWDFVNHQTGYCANLVTDDVVAHELTHGVTQFTANLIYQNQSGQLNESFSDIFGELVDLFNGGAETAGSVSATPWTAHPTGPGTDEPNNLRTFCSSSPSHANGVRWLFAEDSGGGWNGAIRDMWSPVCMGDPDVASSPFQTCAPLDSGGVHSGSGIPNHAFAMLTDGKSFNGYTVTGIGAIKAGAVWYRALSTYLVVASDFQDAYAAFNQAASDLIDTYPNDPRTGLPSGDVFTAADALQVDTALLAVEMNTPGACGETAVILDPTPPLLCADRVAILADDFESGAGGWTVYNSGPPTPYDWVLTADPLPKARPGVAWYCDDPILGDCSTDGVPEMGTHSLVSPEMEMPADLHLPALAFVHFVEIEPRYDGGQVAVRINGDDWQAVPAAAYRQNPYNTTLFTAGQGSTNPNAGQIAFSGADSNWGTSLIDLGTMVAPGDTLQVKFEFSKDWCYGITGWWIDDFEVYHCPAGEDCNGNGVADDVDLAAGPHRDAIVLQPPNHSSGNASDLDDADIGVTALADNVILLKQQAIESVRLWGGYYPDSLEPPDHFTVIFHDDGVAGPGAVVAVRSDVTSSRLLTGGDFLGLHVDEWEYTLTFDQAVVLEAGTYFVEILNDTTGSPDTFFWQRALVGHIPGAYGAFEAPGQVWLHDPLLNFSLELYGPVVGNDCNANGYQDACDQFGDHTGDGFVDLADHAALAACLTGPVLTAVDECTCLLDVDGDGDLDLLDFAALQRTFGD